MMEGTKSLFLAAKILGCYLFAKSLGFYHSIRVTKQEMTNGPMLDGFFKVPHDLGHRKSGGAT